MSSSLVIQQLKSQGNFFSLSMALSSELKSGLSFALDNNTQVDITDVGLIRFTPSQKPRKAIVLSCAVHGNETAPIELCDDLVKRILTGQITLSQPLLIIFANLPAIAIEKRFVEENMNRLFSGAHSQSDSIMNTERKRAAQLERVVGAFFESYEAQVERHHYDLHTAIRDSKHEKFAVYPYTHGESRSELSCRFLKASGIDTILLSDRPTTTFSYFSANEFGAIAFTLELGKVKPFGRNDMNRFSDIKQQIEALISVQTYHSPDVDIDDLNIYRVNQTILRQSESFELHFDDDIPNFTAFAQGEAMATNGDTVYKAEHDGEAIVFPNAKVAMGQRALLTIVKCDLQYGVI
jgi:succinylglutamate desuccinylase